MTNTCIYKYQCMYACIPYIFHVILYSVLTEVSGGLSSVELYCRGDVDLLKVLLIYTKFIHRICAEVY